MIELGPGEDLVRLKGQTCLFHVCFIVVLGIESDWFFKCTVLEKAASAR